MDKCFVDIAIEQRVTNNIIMKIFDITKASKEEEVTNVVNGMLNAKKEWLEMINKREKELGLA